MMNAKPSGERNVLLEEVTLVGVGAFALYRVVSFVGAVVQKAAVATFGFFLSIWPILANVLAVGVLGYVLYRFGRRVHEKLQARRSEIFKLECSVYEKVQQLRESQYEMDRLKRSLAYSQARTQRLKTAMARSHRLVVRNNPHLESPAEKRRRALQAQARMSAALKEFGVYSPAKAQGGKPR